MNWTSGTFEKAAFVNELKSSLISWSFANLMNFQLLDVLHVDSVTTIPLTQHITDAENDQPYKTHSFFVVVILWQLGSAVTTNYIPTPFAFFCQLSQRWSTQWTRNLNNERGKSRVYYKKFRVHCVASKWVYM